ncbi:MAG: hypothetical protein A3K18_09805 [Lentisphaerae bacterium RIFOXYA12_64_32]|nr:MAG: hypothetical protein A3K18_09805 [Lentisphaerae bacterium RIFOXYA12_64_32]
MLAFAYDYMGRRVRKTVYDWATDHWSLTTDHCFVWSGWLPVMETVTESDGTVTRREYVWALDLAGEIDGAGVGGLAAIIETRDDGTPDDIARATEAGAPPPASPRKSPEWSCSRP